MLTRIAIIIFFSIPGILNAQTQNWTFPLGLNSKVYQTITATAVIQADSVSGDTVKNGESKHAASEVAVNIATDFRPDNSGIWNSYMPGYRSWILKIQSRRAYGIAVVIADLNLREGEKLFVYNMNGLAGSFDNRNIPASGILPLNFLKGEEIVIEYNVPSGNAETGSFKIEMISHAFRDIFSRFSGMPENSSGQNIRSADDDCYTCLDAPSLENNRRATVKMVIFSNTGALLCTGTLLNNTAGDRRPYVLTAQHCISDPEEASRTVFIFDYEDPQCGAISLKENLTLHGSMYRASLYENDFALVELLETPPAAFKPYYAGWDISDRNLTDVFTVHHPGGGPKRISVSNSKVTAASFNDGTERSAGAYWRVDKWDLGVTEGGSSGAPLFNSANYLIGTLTGGSSECGIPLNDYFQRLSASWEASQEEDKQLKYWLDPLQTETTRLAGLDPVEGDVMDCESVSNFQPGEIPSLMPYVSGNGFFSGYNPDGIATWAEKFFTEERAILTTARFNIGSVNTVSPGGIIVTIYGDDDGRPGASLSEIFIPYYKIRSVGLNTFELSSPVSVSGVFYIGFTMSYSDDDIFTVLQAPWREGNRNSAFVKVDGEWSPITSLSPTGTGSALDIQALLCRQLPPPDNNSYSTVVVYPNPCKSVLLAKVPFEPGELRIEVLDMQGATHITGYHLYDNTLVVTVSGLSPGMYIIRVFSNGAVYQSKFVKE